MIVGRRAELAAARTLVDATSRGQGAALLISGEAGVGKSRLVAEVRARAEAGGLDVLVGHAVDGGGTFRPVAEALARPLRRRPLLDAPRLRPFRAALRGLLPGPTESEPEPHQDRLDPSVVLGEGVLALLAEAGEERGCLLVLEDLHWADPDTLDLVGYLAGAVTGTRVLLVLTARDDVVLPGVARLAAAPGVTVLPLGRLDEAGVGALAAACRGGVPLPVAELHELVARSDGLPFLVEELLGADAGSSRVPPTLAGLVTRRLAGLPEAGRPLVVAAAVAGGDPDWRLVSAVTGAAEPAVLQALRGAVEVGLLTVEDGRLRWRHALTRDAVLATLLPPERAALAARAARALDDRGEPEDRAAAAGLYVEAGDRRRGAEILLALARIDVRRGALRTAAMLLERAAATGAPAGPVVIEQVQALSLLGRAADAIDVGGGAMGLVFGDEHAELCLRLARAAVVAGRWAVAEQFVERAGRPADPRSLTLTADAAYGAGDVARARTAGRAAVQVVEQAGVVTPEHAALLCEALTVLARGTFGPDPSGSESMLRRAAQVAAEHGLTPWRVEALFGLGSHEHTAGDPAAPSLALARELALEAGLLVHAVQADLLRADAVLLVDGPIAALPCCSWTWPSGPAAAAHRHAGDGRAVRRGELGDGRRPARDDRAARPRRLPARRARRGRHARADGARAAVPDAPRPAAGLGPVRRGLPGHSGARLGHPHRALRTLGAPANGGR